MLCQSCSSTVKPVFVSDIDGTLGDYHMAFPEFACRYHNMPLPVMAWDGSGEMEDYLGMTKQQYRDAKLAYRQGGNKRWMPVYAGASEMLRDVRRAGGEVWLATTRPWQRLDNIDPDTREWLRRNEMEYDGLLYSEDKYRQLAEQIDIKRVIAVYDDLPEMYDAAAEVGMPAILRENAHNVATRGDRLTMGPKLARGEVLMRIERWRETHAQ